MAVGEDSTCGPTWSVFIALANHVNGKPLGFINPKLYRLRNRPIITWLSTESPPGRTAAPRPTIASCQPIVVTIRDALEIPSPVELFDTGGWNYMTFLAVRRWFYLTFDSPVDPNC